MSPAAKVSRLLSRGQVPMFMSPRGSRLCSKPSRRSGVAGGADGVSTSRSRTSERVAGVRAVGRAAEAARLVLNSLYGVRVEEGFEPVTLGDGAKILVARPTASHGYLTRAAGRDPFDYYPPRLGDDRPRLLTIELGPVLIGALRHGRDTVRCERCVRAGRVDTRESYTSHREKCTSHSD